MNKSYKTKPWKTEHRSDGVSFMAVPFDVKNKGVEYAWVLGPLDREIIEFIEEAIREKQRKVNE